VPYWDTIRVNFLGIRRKLAKRGPSLKLDLSAIDNKEPPLQSPSSFNFSDNDFFKRFGSEPDEVLDLREFQNKETNRSERFSHNLASELLRRENEELKQKILAMTEDRVELEEHAYELQLKVQELEIKLVTLENETSIKGLEFNFRKLLDYLLEE
jgi:hypothetical protein